MVKKNIGKAMYEENFGLTLLENLRIKMMFYAELTNFQC